VALFFTATRRFIGSSHMLMEMVEVEATIFHGRTAFRALKLLLAECDRLENPGRRPLTDHRKTIKAANKTLEDVLSLELEQARRRLEGC
jgi:hypothetical protein